MLALMLHNSVDWPPKPPELDRGVYFGGFPGKGRELQEWHPSQPVYVNWTSVVHVLTVETMSETHLVLPFIKEELVRPNIPYQRFVPDDWDPAGSSGAPLLTHVERRMNGVRVGLMTWRLAGIVTEMNSMFIRAARADCLEPDGHIREWPDFTAYTNGKKKRIVR